MTKKVLILFMTCLLSYSNGAKILGVFPVPAPSHYILGSSLMRGLASKGHNVTVISPFSENDPPKNGTYRDIILTGFWEAAQKRREEVNFFDIENINSFVHFAYMHSLLLHSTEHTLNHTNVKKLIHSNETFDVVIVEQFMNDALKAFSSHFKAPLILFSTVGANGWINLITGNPAPPSYVPALFLSYSSKMSFFERTINSLMYIFNELVNYLYVFPQHAALVEKYFPNKIDFNNVLYNASVILVNSHQSTNQPVPYVPSMIDIGGFHVKPPKQLPQDLRKFLDEAQDGVIYFSFGSNIKSSQLPIEKRNAFLKTFGKLKEKVLWKWEEDILPGQPANVKLGKWLPQQDILAHPNVKLFITHGGLLSKLESIYNGVPVLAIPIFGDQRINAQDMVNNGYGLCINYQDISEDLLNEKLKMLLTDSRYAINAKRRSKIYHDRLNNPMDTAVFWTEYVVRNKGAPHLRVSALDLPLYQYFLLDVTIFILVIILIVLYLISKCARKVMSCDKRRNEEKIKRS